MIVVDPASAHSPMVRQLLAGTPIAGPSESSLRRKVRKQAPGTSEIGRSARLVSAVEPTRFSSHNEGAPRVPLVGVLRHDRGHAPPLAHRQERAR